jgi:hypothetical protein
LIGLALLGYTCIPCLSPNKERSVMPIDDLGVRDLATHGAIAGAMGILGRLLALATSARRPSGWNLLWEVPLAIAMGVIGKGIADYFALTGFPNFAVIIAVSYSGPRIIDIMLSRYNEGKSLKIT